MAEQGSLPSPKGAEYQQVIIQIKGESFLIVVESNLAVKCHPNRPTSGVLATCHVHSRKVYLVQFSVVDNITNPSILLKLIVG